MSKRAAALELVKKHGRTTTSFRALGDDLHLWFDEDACVAYTQSGSSWVVAGSPIAPPHREIEVMERFAAEATRRRKRVRFFAIERDVSAESSFSVLHVGEQPVWDPAHWPACVGKRVRGQIRRALAKGDVVLRQASAQELSEHSHPTRRGIDTIIDAWHDSRRMAPMGFLVRIDPFHLVEERRVFLAEHRDTIVGVLVAVPIYARQGWFLDQMLRHPTAPNGTVDLMFDYAMRSFAETKSPYVTFGLSPLSGTPSRSLQIIRDRTRFLYNFTGLHTFKAKLGPSAWHPIYLAYPKHEQGVRAVIDTLGAFTPNGFVRFAWDTLRRRGARLFSRPRLQTAPPLGAAPDEPGRPEAAEAEG